ncbi:DUF1285 domain-containing protein [Thalassotalea ganghwensis]
MSLDKLSAQLKEHSAQSMPPVELWDPPYCGEMDIRIANDGTWFYNGTPFKRMALVKLFASVLKYEKGDYFLVTPVEKVKITVDDAPLLLTQWQLQQANGQSVIGASTNLDDSFFIGEEHPVSQNQQGELYVVVRRNLNAKVHRNVYYQWVELGKETKTDNGIELLVTSGDYQFSLGRLD